MTLLEAIQQYEAIRKRIRSARIGVGANKHTRYGGKPRQRKARITWANKLSDATREMEQFVKDAAFQKVTPAIDARLCEAMPVEE